MKVLSFGHIPSWAGGLQNSGLANVIYQLAKNMAASEDVEMTMAATDVFIPLMQDGHLSISGWSKGLLIRYALIHPLTSTKWLYHVYKAKCIYGPVISIPGFFFKGLHLSRTIHIVKPDAVHLHGMAACVYEHAVPKNVKIVVTVHGIVGEDKTIPYQLYRYKMERDTCHSNRYSLMGFIAEKLIEDFRQCYGHINSPCRAILNAYDAKAFNYIAPIDHRKLTLATVASFSDNKGQRRVIEGIAKSGIKAKYICIGNAAEEDLRDYAHEADINNVDFDYRGKQSPSDIRKILAEADYMILPSSTEGFGLVYLEAIACGVPVIVPKHLPIVQEKGIIQPGVNALLLEDSSSDAIAKLLPTLKDYHFDHKNVANTIVDYSWENIAKEYIECFKEIIR